MRITLTAEHFARLILKNDLKEHVKWIDLDNSYPPDTTLESLPDDERQCYIHEAELYLSLPLNAWPVYILEQLQFS